MKTFRFLAGFLLLYAVLAGLGELDPGRNGVPVLGVIVLLAIAADRLLGPTREGTALERIGLGRPDGRAVALAIGVAVLIQGVYPLAAAMTGATISPKPWWPLLLIGVFAFHGLAEELVWRGYAFQRLRQGRSFAAAVIATMPLIAATHIPIVVSSGLAVGIAAMMVAAVTSLPLAHLYELGRNTVWAPAVVHTGIDSFKLVTVPDDARMTFSLLLAGVSIVVPLLALVVRRRTLASTALEVR